MRLFSFLLFIVAISVNSVNGQISFISNDACYGQLTAMSATSTSPDTVATWAWDFDNDGVYDDAWSQTTNYIFDTTGFYNIGLVVTYTNGSSDTLAQDIVINELPAVNFFIDNLCEDDFATFEDNSTIGTGSIVAYYWDFDNDGSADEVGQIVQYNHGPAGLYVTNLECVSDAGCSSNTSKQNEVFEKPTADFQSSISPVVGSNTYFTNTTFISSGSIEIYSWDFGDGEGSSIEDPSHGFKTAQAYTVQLITISDQDCRDTIQKVITVDEAVGVGDSLGVASEVVTPNGDGFNDVLIINALDQYTNCKVTIYNSWNEIVFVSDGYSNTEGGFTAEDVDAGAFYYIIECDEEKPVLGVINVLK